ncbi:hypothetical protein AGMMS50267_05780 [Spirochaetia bacterium]|nr:hypothetical protein AGMMS50267_05780 [Spirochaetia bacterium]
MTGTRKRVLRAPYGLKSDLSGKSLKTEVFRDSLKEIELPVFAGGFYGLPRL